MPRLRRLAVLAAALLVLISASSGPRPASAAGPVLRFVAGEVRSLDPAFIADQGDVQLMLQLYAGLTRLDENAVPYPSLAESWQVSDDRLTYTFRLRDGLRFSDGSPLEAGDVRRSWLRLLDPEVAARAPEVLAPIQGADERRAGLIGEDEVGIEASDSRTVVVRLRHPAGYFPSLTASPATYVVPRGADASPDWQTPDDFVGSGPYRIERMEGEDLVLRANSDYVLGAPPIDEIRWIGRLDGSAATAFADDEVDLVSIPSSDAAWIAYDPDLGPSLQRAAPLNVQYLGFDTTRPPFDDPRVRRAFALALDRGRLVELAAGTDAQPATSIVPPALWPAGWRTDARELAGDADEALDLLAEAGYEDPADLGPISVNITSHGGSAVAAWRDGLGIELESQSMDFSDYLTDLEEHPEQIFSVSWVVDYPSPQALYGLLLMPSSSSNFGGWDDDEFVALLEAAAAADDPAEQAAAYTAVEERVDAEAPLIPWSYGETWWLVRDGLRGVGNLTTGLLDLGRVSWDG